MGPAFGSDVTHDAHRALLLLHDRLLNVCMLQGYEVARRSSVQTYTRQSRACMWGGVFYLRFAKSRILCDTAVSI